MKFTIFNLLVLLPAIAYAADGDRIANTLDSMAELSKVTGDSAVELLASADSINRFFPEIIEGFALITTSAQNEVMVLSPGNAPPKPADTTPLVESTQHGICNQFTHFVQVHQQLLNIVIGKHDILQQTLAMAPIKQLTAALLKNLEACSTAVTDMSNLFKVLVPTCVNQVVADKKVCDAAIQRLTVTLQSFQ